MKIMLEETLNKIISENHMSIIFSLIASIPTTFFLTYKYLENHYKMGRQNKNDEIESLKKQIELYKESDGSPDSSFLIEEKSKLANEIDSSSDLSIIAMNLGRTIVDNLVSLEKILSNGRNIKVLLVDPESPCISYISKRNVVYNTERVLTEKINESLGHLKKLESSRGSIEVRVLDYVPSFGLTIIRKSKESRIRVDIYPFQSDPAMYPAFWVGSSQEKWFRFFEEQFNKLWIEAESANS